MLLFLNVKMGMTGSRDKVQSQCILFVSKFIYCCMNSQIYNFLILFGKKSCNEWNRIKYEVRKQKKRTPLLFQAWAPSLTRAWQLFSFFTSEPNSSLMQLIWAEVLRLCIMSCSFAMVTACLQWTGKSKTDPKKGNGFACGCFHRKLLSPCPSCPILLLFCVLPVSFSLLVALGCTCSPIRLNRWSSFSRMVHPYVQAQGWLCRQAQSQELWGDTRRPIVT